MSDSESSVASDRHSASKRSSSSSKTKSSKSGSKSTGNKRRESKESRHSDSEGGEGEEKKQGRNSGDEDKGSTRNGDKKREEGKSSKLKPSSNGKSKKSEPVNQGSDGEGGDPEKDTRMKSDSTKKSHKRKSSKHRSDTESGGSGSESDDSRRSSRKHGDGHKKHSSKSHREKRSKRSGSESDDGPEKKAETSVKDKVVAATPSVGKSEEVNRVIPIGSTVKLEVNEKGETRALFNPLEVDELYLKKTRRRFGPLHLQPEVDFKVTTMKITRGSKRGGDHKIYINPKAKIHINGKEVFRATMSVGPVRIKSIQCFPHGTYHKNKLDKGHEHFNEDAPNHPLDASVTFFVSAAEWFEHDSVSINYKSRNMLMIIQKLQEVQLMVQKKQWEDPKLRVNAKKAVREKNKGATEEELFRIFCDDCFKPVICEDESGDLGFFVTRYNSRPATDADIKEVYEQREAARCLRFALTPDIRDAAMERIDAFVEEEKKQQATWLKRNGPSVKFVYEDSKKLREVCKIPVGFPMNRVISMEEQEKRVLVRDAKTGRGLVEKDSPYFIPVPHDKVECLPGDLVMLQLQITANEEYKLKSSMKLMLDQMHWIRKGTNSNWPDPDNLPFSSLEPYQYSILADYNDLNADGNAYDPSWPEWENQYKLGHRQTNQHPCQEIEGVTMALASSPAPALEEDGEEDGSGDKENEEEHSE